MGKIKGSQTEKNLLTAFAGESQARNRYTYFASQAKKDGFVQISSIFEETANQEKEHAKRFFKFLEGGEAEVMASFPAGVIGSTLENLKAAAAGEHYEHTQMYPGFARKDSMTLPRCWIIFLLQRSSMKNVIWTWQQILKPNACSNGIPKWYGGAETAVICTKEKRPPRPVRLVPTHRPILNCLVKTGNMDSCVDRYRLFLYQRWNR
jgi:hypothetical protein